MLKRITISDRYYQKNMKIREFNNELYQFVTEHLNLKESRTNHFEIYEEDSIFPNDNPKMWFLLNRDVVDEDIKLILSFIEKYNEGGLNYIVNNTEKEIEIKGLYF